jgi:hypothetical protein
MRRNRGAAIAAFFENLADGDPVAWGMVGLAVLFLAFIGLVILKTRRDHRLEDEARDRRRGYKLKKE